MSPFLTAPDDVQLRPGRIPLLETSSQDPAAWAAGHRDALRAAVLAHGCVLVRGLDLRTPADVTAVFGVISAEPVIEREPFATRQRYSDGVYSSAKWPANQPMCMHHELSYRLEFPGMLMFGCLAAPTAGGATAVADAAAVLAALPPAVVSRFEREGWILTRSYNDEIGASLAESFGTADRTSIETYCRANGITYAWGPDGELRTRQRRRAVVEHPQSGRRCWFNQVAFLNEWTMAAEVHEYLVDVYGADGLPFNTRYGNGDPIPAEVVQAINQVYDELTVREPWESGDLMLVDNIRTAHSREAYQGARDVLVGLADPVRAADWSGTSP